MGDDFISIKCHAVQAEDGWHPAIMLDGLVIWQSSYPESSAAEARQRAKEAFAMSLAHGLSEVDLHDLTKDRLKQDWGTFE
jgi:hypothetical protein